MLKYLRLIVLFLFFGFCFYPALEAAGLTTGFGELIVENLEIGRSYSTEKTAGLPLSIVNTGKEDVDLKIEVLLPQEEELKDGFEPIPDISWVKLQKSEFKEVKPNETATTDVIVSIPRKKEYQGKNYQVYIWSHTIGTTIGVGLKSRLLLVIKD